MENRKLAVLPPPPGIVWIEDYRDPNTGEVVTAGIASRIGISPSTYRKWRMRGEGPRTFNLGKKVAARISAIEEWLNGLDEAAGRQMEADQATAERDGRPAEPRIHRHPVAA